MKIRYQSVMILTSILLILLSDAAQAGAEEHTIRVYGAVTFAEPIQALGNEFMGQHPDLQVKVRGGTSESGFEALLNGQADLAIATREPTIVERRLAQGKGIKWQGGRVAREDVAVISHPGVGLTELTVDQLRKIYAGDFKNWQNLGGVDQIILPHSMAYPQDDIAVWFFDTVLSKTDFAPGIIWIKVPDFLVQHVSVHPGAVAYLGNLQLTAVLKRQPQLKVQILNIRSKAESSALSSSEEISEKGDYPLSIPLFLFWNENNPNKLADQFAGFCMKKLQGLIGR